MDESEIVEKEILGKKMFMRQSHLLPYYLKEYPFYDRALPRLSKLIEEKEGFLSFVDVGANIGDTYELVSRNTKGRFLCIEGDEDFCKILKQNTLGKTNILIEKSFCGEKDELIENIILDKAGGTGKLEVRDTTHSQINFKSIDTIINSYKNFKNVNFIKIDTDGFEISILKGSRNTLKKFKPALFLEFTPNYFIEKKQSPLEFFEILFSNGYNKALIYDNFGVPIRIINTDDKLAINSLIEKIDNSKIYYYDVFTVHNSKNKSFEEIIEKELFEFIHLSNFSYLNIKNEVTSSKDKFVEKKEYPDRFILISAEKEKLRNEMERKSEIYENKILELKSEIDSIKKTKGWRLLSEFRVKFAKMFPKYSYRWKVVRKVYKLLRGIYSQIKNKPERIKYINKNINKSSKKILYIGHSYHSKTKSTQFLLDYLNENFDVKVLLDESWQGKAYPDLSFVDESYLAVIFFQQIPPLDILKNVKNNNIIYFPMYDGFASIDFDYWNNLKNCKIVNFSSTLHNKLTKWGLNSLYVQFFPLCNEFIPGNSNEMFFWQRVNSITFNTVKEIIRDSKIKLHIHKAVDPGNSFLEPSKRDEEEYKITYSQWFEKKEDLLNVIKEKSIYFAPRVTEGIGQSFLEAMAMGKAVVAPNNPTMNEYITHNINGYLYELNDLKKIDFSNIKEIQKNSYNYIKAGRVKWEKEINTIKEFIYRD